jgi:hypothetical protein
MNHVSVLFLIVCIRMSVASNPHTPASALTRLAGEKNKSVGWLAEENLNPTEDIHAADEDY